MTETQEKIIKASIELFSEQGIKATTTRGIAAKAGVNESTIFRSFGSKEALFKEILSMNSDMPTILRIFQNSTAEDDLRNLLISAAELFQKMYREIPHIMKIVLRCAMDREELETVENLMGPGAFQYLAETLKRQQAAGKITLKASAEKTSFYFLSLIHGSFQRALIFKEMDQEIDVHELVDTYLTGVM